MPRYTTEVDVTFRAMVEAPDPEAAFEKLRTAYTSWSELMPEDEEPGSVVEGLVSCHIDNTRWQRARVFFDDGDNPYATVEISDRSLFPQG